MDLRIVNTCNNNCIYCLEQSLRKKKKFIDKSEIFEKIKENKDKEILSFYGGNPLLHPDLLKIISFAKQIGYKNIALLTNTFSISEKYLSDLKNAGLNGISFYFNSFSPKKQELISNNGISLTNLLKNIEIIVKNIENYKCIIHLNNQNIDEILKDIIILNKKLGVKNFEFVKYYLVSRAKKNYGNLLEFDKEKEKNFIVKMSLLAKKYNLVINFIRF